MVAELENEL